MTQHIDILRRMAQNALTEVEALRAENAQLRDALDELSRLRNLLRGLYEPDGCGNKCNPTCAVCQVAKAVWQ